MGKRFSIGAILLLLTCATAPAAPRAVHKRPGLRRGTGTARRDSRPRESVQIPPALESGGRVRRVEGGTLVVDAEDTRILTLQIRDRTVLSEAIREGAMVHVEARTDSAGNLIATRVDPILPGNDTGSPGLGMFPPAAPTLAIDTADELLRRTTLWVSTLTEKLPDYVCRQLITRSRFESKQSGWQVTGLVSAEVAYVEGREVYENIMVEGRRSEKKMAEISGTKSTGEYATALRDLFAPQTGAQFERSRASTINGTRAIVYDFRVPREHSDWRVFIGGQAIVPAITGSLWVDAETARVLRLEMQADSIPSEFPLDRVEAAVEYGRVGFGSGALFLPVRAENLACHRGTYSCDKNLVEFRNYRRYGSDSRVQFVK